MDRNEKILGMDVGTFISVVIILAGIVLMGALWSLQPVPESSSGEYGTEPAPGAVASEAFAECITQSGAVFYGTDWCPHCQEQKALFGEHMEEINFVECETNGDLCNAAGVTVYPTWIINGKKHFGTQSLPELASLTGCSLD